MKLEEFKSIAQVTRNESSQNFSVEIIEGADVILNTILGEGDTVPSGELGLAMAIIMQDGKVIKQQNGSDSVPRAYIVVPKTKAMLSFSAFRHYAGIAGVRYDVTGSDKAKKVNLSKGFQIKKRPELVNNRYDWTTAEAVAVE